MGPMEVHRTDPQCLPSPGSGPASLAGKSGFVVLDKDLPPLSHLPVPLMVLLSGLCLHPVQSRFGGD